MSSSATCPKHGLQDCGPVYRGLRGFFLPPFCGSVICLVFQKKYLCIFGYIYLMISILVSNFLKHTLLKDCRDMPYLIENKIPSLIQGHTVSIPRETSSSLVQEPDKYMIEATADTGTLNSLMKVQQTFRHSNLTSYFSSSLVSYPSMCN